MTVVLGGYGFFGSRICTALARNPAIELLIAGRHIDAAKTLARELGLPDGAAITLDANAVDLGHSLQKLRARIVVHTAGPFQGQDQHVARAAIAAGCHYIDLADGRQFVTGIVGLDSLARARAVTVVSGASSVPALSSAVIERYLPQFARLESIGIGISSGARAPGIATVRGIFGYCGKPIRQWIDGAWQTRHGWHDLQRHHFPAPVGARWVSSCDVPDLDLLPQRYPSVRTVTFRAGFASDLGHLVVWSIAGLVKHGLLNSAVPLAPALNALSRWLEPLLSDKGGMFVKLAGTGVDGRAKQIVWHVLAAQNHGPNIPCGAAIALVNKLADGVALPHGAMPCIGLLSVEEYLLPLQGLDVHEVA